MRAARNLFVQRQVQGVAAGAGNVWLLDFGGPNVGRYWDIRNLSVFTGDDHAITDDVTVSWYAINPTQFVDASGNLDLTGCVIPSLADQLPYSEGISGRTFPILYPEHIVARITAPNSDVAPVVNSSTNTYASDTDSMVVSYGSASVGDVALVIATGVGDGGTATFSAPESYTTLGTTYNTDSDDSCGMWLTTLDSTVDATITTTIPIYGWTYAIILDPTTVSTADGYNGIADAGYSVSPGAPTTANNVGDLTVVQGYKTVDNVFTLPDGYTTLFDTTPSPAVTVGYIAATSKGIPAAPTITTDGTDFNGWVADIVNVHGTSSSAGLPVTTMIAGTVAGWDRAITDLISHSRVPGVFR